MFERGVRVCSSVFEREARELEVIFHERVIQLAFEFELIEHYVRPFSSHVVEIEEERE